MSTFKGIIAEFPQIRIDYFRHQPDHKAPLACFLSHVHSDHLTGLESMRAPFVYCSAATREILLRLEKHFYRLNHAKGILESTNVTYDRSIRKLAKPLPLDTPTMIELAPGNSIRVTLLDANHCVGAVMFLIEGDSKAVLYTGDIRAEPWWINSLVQNPVLLPYTLRKHKLDCIYLDTTFAASDEQHRNFPSKAEGIRELLEKVGDYPNDTVFYFHSWTFGYENVWVALSAFLGSQIHVDDYRARIYSSLSSLDKAGLQDAGLNVQTDNKFLRESGIQIHEGPTLCGFRNGNRIQTGCLTSNENVRIHSCEHGMGCRVMDDDDAAAKVVRIVPIVTRCNGIDIVEAGAGGGKGDLNQKEGPARVDMADVHELMEMCAEVVHDKESAETVFSLLQRVVSEGRSLKDLIRELEKHIPDNDNAQPLQRLTSAISSLLASDAHNAQTANQTIYFPYSRHSSYSELCSLVEALKPKDVYPCTVDEATWSPATTIKTLFGAYCSSRVFRHDEETMPLYQVRVARARKETELYGETQGHVEDMDTDTSMTHEGVRMDTQSLLRLTGDVSPPLLLPLGGVRKRIGDHGSDRVVSGAPGVEEQHSQKALNSDANHAEHTNLEPEAHLNPVLPGPRKDPEPHEPSPPLPRTKNLKVITPINAPARHIPTPPHPDKDKGKRQKLHHTPSDPAHPALQDPPPSAPHLPPARKKKKRAKMSNTRIAYEAAGGILLTWADYGGLECTRREEDREEVEL